MNGGKATGELGRTTTGVRTVGPGGEGTADSAVFSDGVAPGASRLEALRMAVARGTYRISSEAIAEALMRRMSLQR